MRHKKLRPIWLAVIGVFVGSLLLAQGDPISWSPASPKVNQEVSFSFSGSENETVFKWDFGDNHTQVSQDTSVTHTYTEADSYDVKVHTSKGGTTIEYERTITIRN